MALLMLLAAGAIVLSCVLSSCRHGQQPALSPQPRAPLELPGPPTLRVRLTVAPMSVATVRTTGAYRILADGRVAAQSTSALPATRVSRSGRTWLLEDRRVDASAISIEPSGPGRVVVEGTEYRGWLRLRAEGDGLVAINHVEMEDYLAGVLPKELYPHWSPATYRALAVAARTFALYEARNFGAGHDFDLYAGELSQCYGGFSAETPKSRQASADTRGQVLICPDATGNEDIFLAQYSACCGGVVNSASMIRHAPGVPTLAGGQVCQDCASAPKYRWPAVRVTKEEIHRALLASYPAAAELGGVSQVVQVSATAAGRPMWLDVVGASGRRLRIRAYDLRLALLRTTASAAGLYSINCRILDRGQFVEFADGAGHGHGVGLCQWGAQAKALAGWSDRQILGFYYPQARLLTAY